MVVLDIQGTQSLDHRDRGVAGHVRHLALAVERIDPAAVAAYALNRDLPLPGGIEPLVASGKLRYSDEIDWRTVDVLHVMSPYELSVPFERLVPEAFTGTLAVTLFDLISEVLADPYLEDPGLRRRYRARHELLRQADLVLAISDAARSDGARLLGLDEQRVRVTPLAPSPRFVPGDDRDRDGYVLYTGGTDHRKNVDRLLEAWGLLPQRLRDRHRLVFAFAVKPLERNHYEVIADRLGFRDGLDVLGWVSDADMVALTQRARLVVYPALYEGFGLPVAEALACHTPAIASNTSSLPELLPDDALFDPYDAREIASAIERALVDGTHRQRLVDVARRAPRRTYDDVAHETLDAYASVRSRQRVAPVHRRGQRRPGASRLAFVSPLPPVPGGVSAYSARLLAALAADADGLIIDAYVDGPPHVRELVLQAGAGPTVTTRPVGTFDRVEAVDGRYDHLVICLGNSEYHTGGLALLHRRPGATVIAHDVRLTNLHRFAQWQHPAPLGGTFHDALHRMYPRLPPALGGRGALDQGDAERWGVMMAKEAIAASRRYLLTSRFARELARLDAAHGDADKLGVLPFSLGNVPLADPTPADVRLGPPVVASFGVVNDAKDSRAIVDAFALVREEHPDAQLVFVGPAGDEEAALLRAPGVELTGALPDESYVAWLDRAWVAVQLRSSTNGESSAAVGDCLAAGVPTIVTGIGAARDLPDNGVVKTPAGTSAGELAGVISSLIEAPERRRGLFDGARAYAEDHSFAHGARALLALLAAEQ